MERMISNIKEKLMEIGADSMVDAARGKLKEVGGEKIISTLLEKLKELLQVIQNFVGELIGWLDEAFPPETRRERLKNWVQLGARSPFIIIGLALLVLFLYRSQKPRKMMKAPGRSFRMERKKFEANPKLYFRDLRAKKKRN